MYIPRTLCFTFALLASAATAAKNPKRGLAFAEGDNPNDIKKVDQASSVVSWQYDWGQAAPDYLAKTSIPYIPMQWGTNGIETFASKVKAQGAKRILVSLLLSSYTGSALMLPGRPSTNPILPHNLTSTLLTQLSSGNNIFSH